MAFAEVRLGLLIHVVSVMRACNLNVSQTIGGVAVPSFVARYYSQSATMSSSSGNNVSQKGLNLHVAGGLAGTAWSNRGNGQRVN